MFGTTPGGSKIVYDRLYLLKVRDSPASHVSKDFCYGRVVYGPKLIVPRTNSCTALLGQYTYLKQETMDNLFRGLLGSSRFEMFLF